MPPFTQQPPRFVVPSPSRHRSASGQELVQSQAQDVSRGIAVRMVPMPAGAARKALRLAVQPHPAHLRHPQALPLQPHRLRNDERLPAEALGLEARKARLGFGFLHPPEEMPERRTQAERPRGPHHLAGQRLKPVVPVPVAQPDELPAQAVGRGVGLLPVAGPVALVALNLFAEQRVVDVARGAAQLPELFRLGPVRVQTIAG